MKVHLRRDEGGDWIQVIVDGRFRYSGHSVPDFLWEQLLEEAGCEVKVENNLTEEELLSSEGLWRKGERVIMA